MFANIAGLSLVTLALSATGLASSHGQLLNRHHAEIAKRQPANHTLERRVSNSRWSFYDVETGNAGSCGKFHVNSDFTVAMNDEQMNSGLCFKTIRMSYNGKTTTASVSDTCPGCPLGGLDLTEGLFKYFAPASVGIIYGEWEFTDGSGGGSNSKPTTTSTPPKKTTSVWHPPSTTSVWQPPKTTATKEKPTSTSTSVWVPPTTTKKTSTSTKASTTSTSTHSITSSTTSSTSSTSSSSSINYSTGAAAGLAVPTGTIESQPGAPQNVANMYQAFVQVGGLIAGAANI